MFNNIILLFFKNILYNPIISLTILSAIFIAPTKTNILKINSPIYFHTCVTAAALVSTTGGVDANNENIIQPKKQLLTL